ncbi:peptidase domain-containing ABC transporter [Chitinophaga nivalis]|uniref:Peptidase domain-containing ABC transporter n=1 Tax=Chitinophaga nivalis TaxID=2991709 RepID=A0ABT3IUU2_9BACT|nr:peptidase domain-containing ABC transporter [Chitinophaga nivalis]MCW3462591.1 peptidase domain-containing ABC transporter [Chitinophaga nivalis]MCW3487718.1 peptidase domain-containing ABC transporter [Chitinophaga nivalis]
MFSRFKKFAAYHQLEMMDCGPTCLRMIAHHYGKHYSLQTLRVLTRHGKEGVNLLGIAEAAESIGFEVNGTMLSFAELRTEAPLPCIVHWRQQHFVVVYKITARYVYVADPETGRMKYTHADFLKHWSQEKEDGIALLMEPTDAFYQQTGETKSPQGFRMLWGHAVLYKKLILQIILGLGAGTLLQLAFPFLTKSIVDAGIKERDFSLILVILAGQFMLLAGRTSLEFIRRWVLLHISTRINISIISNFLLKLMKLPIPFFDGRMTGDILQRIQDQNRIEQFLTGSVLNILFALLNLVAFTIVLVWYNPAICGLFIGGSALYLLWISVFLRRRRTIDYLKFEISARNQSKLMQLIHGIQEIKLNSCEAQKKEEWGDIQGSLFKANIKSLSLTQQQEAGALFINEGKNLLITAYAATCVINGQLSLGAMLAIQYIIGQLNGPVEQMIHFIQATQDARISMERLQEIHELGDEESDSVHMTKQLPACKDITVSDLTFTYPGAGNEPSLRDISLFIPYGKVTAVIGSSGSGKTTLLKLLLKFYQPEAGGITVGDTPQEYISHAAWRAKCGVVMQDGFIFSDTIAQNICIINSEIDEARLDYAIHIANIRDLIDSLPLGIHTQIGPEGHGISQGQRQRILIARSVYKNPDFIFFDEATNALDATNESIIMHNLATFFKGKTVVIVAHRLSTVKNADNIIVLQKGEIIEQGTHRQLAAAKGAYYTLVKNQLELDD